MTTKTDEKRHAPGEVFADEDGFRVMTSDGGDWRSAVERGSRKGHCWAAEGVWYCSPCGPQDVTEEEARAWVLGGDTGHIPEGADPMGAIIRDTIAAVADPSTLPVFVPEVATEEPGKPLSSPSPSSAGGSAPSEVATPAGSPKAPYGSLMTLVYAAASGGLQEVARSHGYALAIHGSLKRDFDVVAVPWVEDAAPPEALALALTEALGMWRDPKDVMHGPAWKPHGRMAYMIPMGAGWALDVSILRCWPPADSSATASPSGEVGSASGGRDDLDALVDRILLAVCNCHDGNDLWAHTRRDPEAFRATVRHAFRKSIAETTALKAEVAALRTERDGMASKLDAVCNVVDDADGFYDIDSDSSGKELEDGVIRAIRDRCAYAVNTVMGRTDCELAGMSTEVREAYDAVTQWRSVEARALAAEAEVARLEQACACAAAASLKSHMPGVTAEIGQLRFDLAAAEARATAAEAELARLNDLDMLRLQLPDGTVPDGIEQAARGWHQAACEAQASSRSMVDSANRSDARRAAAEAEVQRLTALVKVTDEVVELQKAELADCEARIQNLARALTKVFGDDPTVMVPGESAG